jgi:hypothetical protein
MPKLFRDRILINKLNRLKSSASETYNRICYLSLQIKEKAKILRTDYRLLEKKKHPIFAILMGAVGLIISFPLFLFGFVFNFVFLQIPNISIKKVIDIQFHSSIRYAISLVLAIVLLPVYLILSFVLITPWWLAILIFISIPVAGLFSWSYYLLLRRIIGGLRIRNMMRKGNEEYLLLKKNHDELVTLIAKL